MQRPLLRRIQPKNQLESQVNEFKLQKLAEDIVDFKKETEVKVGNIIEKAESVASGAEEAISEVKSLPSKIKNDFEELTNEIVDALKEIKSEGLKGDKGEDADEEAIEKRLLAKIPEINIDDIAEKASSLVKPTPASLKIIKESVELKDEEIVPKLNKATNLGDLKLSINNIKDWNNKWEDIKGEISRNKGGYHGGGFNNIANASGTVSTGLDTLKFTGAGVSSVTQTGRTVTVDIAGGGGSGTVTNIATAGLISGGPITTTGTITTSMATGKLVGRSTAGTGIMEEITVGSGLSLSGGTLTATGGTGDVVGPASSTDNAIARFDGTTGKLIQNSSATLSDTGVLTVTDIVTSEVKADSSAGLDVFSSAGTPVALFGAGGGANSTFYGGSKFDYATASTIAIFDGTKNLISATTATYPSLTELSYVKGVTSSIQTQLNAKGAGTVTNTGGSLTANAIVLGAGTNDTKVVTGITTDGVSVLNLGVNATTIGKVKMFGNTSGDVTIQPTAAAGTATVQTLPATTGTLVNRVTTGNGVSATNTDGALAFTLGAITPSTVNGNTITTGTGTLTLGAGKTLTVSNTLTFTGTDTNSFAFPSGSSTVMTLASTDTITGVKTFSTAPVFNALPTGTAITSAATASTIVTRDSSANIAFNNWTGGYATTATAAGTTVLTVTSSYDQFFTGSTTQTVTLPVTSTLTLGHEFRIVNNSTGAVTVQSSGANTVLVLAAGTSAIFDCILTSGTTAASWSYKYFGQIITSGKSLSVSNTLTLAGTDASTLNIGTGGTLGTAAFTNSTAYEVPLTFSTGLTRTVNTITVNTSQNISTLSNLTSNGLVTTSGGTGALSVTVPGTGVLTALAVNVGTAGAFVVNGGALGTPSSGTVTNLTGTASININGTVGATTPAAGTFTTGTINTSLTMADAANIVLSGGTANGVLYLNGSKVATSGSALTFDGALLATSGKVHSGSTTGSNFQLFSYQNASTGSSATFVVRQDGTDPIAIFQGASGSEQMRLTSNGNLLIGTTSQVYSEKLAVQNDQNSSTYQLIRNNNSGASAASGLSLNAYGNSWGIEVGSAAKNSNALTFNVDYLGTPVEKMRLTTDGNIGLGTTPSAWHSNFKVLQTGLGYASFVGDSSNGYAEVLNNCYASAASTYNYVASLAATRYSQQLGVHKWYAASAGTGGAAITFTDLMTLNLSGLSIGTSLAFTTGTIELGAASDTTISRSAAGVIAVEGVVIPSISSTNTLTNKRVTKRVVTVNAPGATPTTNTDNCDIAAFTGLSAAITSMTTNLSGTPVNGDMLMFQFTDNGTARAITWGASFASTTVTLPTTTVISTLLRVLVQWNSTSSKWECIGTA